MSQLFSPTAQLMVKLGALAVAGAVVLAVALGAWRVSAYAPQGEPVPQVIPFSHKHHVGDDGIDCRYCHTTVETRAAAGLPSSQICLSCHSQLYTRQQVLAPLMRSAATGVPIPWRRVHQLPDFVFFHHGVHVSNGVACAECHGRVDQMPLTWRARSLDMQWCLACHRDPQPHLHPPEAVFSMAPAELRRGDSPRLAQQLQLHDTRRMTDCSTCHR